MVINASVQYNGGFLPDIILFTQGYYLWGTRLNTCSGFVFTAYVIAYYYYHVMVYYIISVLFLLFF